MIQSLTSHIRKLQITRIAKWGGERRGRQLLAFALMLVVHVLEAFGFYGAIEVRQAPKARPETLTDKVGIAYRDPCFAPRTSPHVDLWGLSHVSRLCLMSHSDVYLSIYGLPHREATLKCVNCMAVFDQSHMHNQFFPIYGNVCS